MAQARFGWGPITNVSVPPFEDVLVADIRLVLGSPRSSGGLNVELAPDSSAPSR